MKRKTAPEVLIGEEWVDDRTATAKEWDSKMKEFVHVWQPGDISADQLARKSMEVVKDEDREVNSGSDILCRVPREVFMRKHKAEQEHSIRSLGQLVKDKRKVTHVRAVKTPISGDGNE